MSDRIDRRRNLLWVDGGAGFAVGVAMLAFFPWLVDWYRLPEDLLRLVAWANVSYGVYSLTLASRPRRPLALIVLLVLANLTWAVLCLRWIVIHSGDGGLLGLLHLGAEAVFVAALAGLEWRWRHLLRRARP